MPAEHDVLIRFNNIFKKEDDLYRNAARLLGCSDCEFWILYTLCLSNQPMTQSELCDMQADCQLFPEEAGGRRLSDLGS